MFVDASALTAIIADEPEADRFIAKIENGNAMVTSPLAVWETTIAVARVFALPVKEAEAAVGRYLERAGIQIAGIPRDVTSLALEAFDRFGKGRHPARLNMGDCFAYACARHYRRPLLYKGGDFALTDIETA
jgi:ribonuclease VapC